MQYNAFPRKTKPWGWTCCIGHNAHYEAWHAFAVAGGFSSRHHHEGKANTFYVLSGELRIRFYNQAGEQTEVHALTAGMSLTAAAGEPHRFEAVTDSHFIETYDDPDGRPIPFEDIVRADVGGIKEDR